MDAEATIRAIALFVGLVTVAGLVGLAVHRLAIPYSVALVVLGMVGAAILPLQLQVSPEWSCSLLPGLVFEAVAADPRRRLPADVRRRRAARRAGRPGQRGGRRGGALRRDGTAAGTRLRRRAMVAATDPVAVISTFKQPAHRAAWRR